MSDYKVGFGKIAKTIIYEDSQGDFRFGYDVEPRNEPAKDQKRTMILEWASSYTKGIEVIKDETLRMAEYKRLRLAFERTKQYLISCGYLVKIWPDEFKDANGPKWMDFSKDR